MSGIRLFIENFLVYGLGGMLSKIIPFIMLPIITRLFPNTDYIGISDLVITIVSFGTSFSILGMYDAMFRMFFEREDFLYRKTICSTALFFTVFTSIVFTIIMLIFKCQISYLFFGDSQYDYLVIIAAVNIMVGATNSIVSAPTRMNNKKMIFLIANSITPLISYSISISLILNKIYTVSLPMGSLLSAIVIEGIFIFLNKSYFSPQFFDWKQLKPLLHIGLPLVPNFVVYWIFNSSDRIMISHILGNDWSGVYAVGARIGMISQLIYTAFAGGWQYFAFSTMKDEDQVEMTSKVFEYLGTISYAATIIISSLCIWIFQVLFKQEYWGGAILVPYLFLAPLLQMLFQVACNQFIVVKKTWPNVFILGAGAFINIIFNFVFIEKIGIEGAAIATFLGYSISVALCIIILQKMNLIKISKRFLIVTLIMLIYFMFWRLYLKEFQMLSFIFSCSVCIGYIIIYRKDIGLLTKKIVSREK